MTDQLSYYDILGVEPGASADEIQRGYDDKAGVLTPTMISGAPSKVVAVVDRARAAIDVARQTLLDPAARQRYDIEIGILRPGAGLVDPVAVPSESGWDAGGLLIGRNAVIFTGAASIIADWLTPHPAPPRHVAVPDVRGLFVIGARRLLVAAGLRCEVSQLTPDPIPVEGLVADQSPRPGTRARRSSTVTVQVWHPARRANRSS
jgi:PASTA domain/DnaJ domain